MERQERFWLDDPVPLLTALLTTHAAANRHTICDQTPVGGRRGPTGPRLSDFRINLGDVRPNPTRERRVRHDRAAGWSDVSESWSNLHKLMWGMRNSRSWLTSAAPDGGLFPDRMSRRALKRAGKRWGRQDRAATDDRGRVGSMPVLWRCAARAFPRASAGCGRGVNPGDPVIVRRWRGAWRHFPWHARGAGAPHGWLRRPLRPLGGSAKAAPPTAPPSLWAAPPTRGEVVA